MFHRQRNVAKRRWSGTSRTPCSLKTSTELCLPIALTAASTPSLGCRAQSFALLEVLSVKILCGKTLSSLKSFVPSGDLRTECLSGIFVETLTSTTWVPPGDIRTECLSEIFAETLTSKHFFH